MRFTPHRLLAFAAGAAVASTVAILTPAQGVADPGVGGCVGVVGVSACANVGVPNINGVVNAIPGIPVPNINIPHVNPGMFRGR